MNTVVKIGGALKEVVESKGQVVAYVSTVEEDHTGEIIDPAGWQLESFRKTGVVQFDHGYGDVGSLPIAKPLEVWMDDHGLLALTQFATDQGDPVGKWASTIFGLIKDDYIRGWSVRFDPLAWIEKDGTKVERARGTWWNGPMPGRRYTKQNLLEYGPVVIPANPDAATVVAKSFARLGARGMWVPWQMGQIAEINAQDEQARCPGKAGRVISAANMQRLRKLRDALTTGAEMCDELIEAGDMMDDEDDDKSLAGLHGLGLAAEGALSQVRAETTSAGIFRSGRA